MKTTVFAALIALASTLFLIGCGTAAIGTAGRPNTQIQVDTSDANASTIPAACLALQRQFVLLHQHIQEAKSEQHQLTASELAVAQAQQAQVQTRLQQCITTATTSTTSFHDNCTSLLGQIKTLQNEARFINYGLHDVVLDQSEIKARQASLAAIQVQIAQLQEKLLTCS